MLYLEYRHKHMSYVRFCTCLFSYCLDNDQLSAILIATIKARDMSSLAKFDAVSIVFIMALPTSRSRARTRPLPT